MALQKIHEIIWNFS